MAHSTRGGMQNQQSTPIHFFDLKLMDQEDSVRVVHDTIEDIIKRGAEILYMKYIDSQIFPYASRTLARELVMNASWASFPLDCDILEADPDEDLALPLIDEWAGGVLPVRGSDSSGLRCSITPQRDVRKNNSANRRARSHLDQQHDQSTSTPSTEKQSSKTTGRASSTIHSKPSKNKISIKGGQNKAKQTPQITEAQIITKKFEEAKKKTNVMMKSVTVDSDFSVIQINEPKGLPPSLIVPKVTTKKLTTSKNQKQTNVVTAPRIARPIVIQKNDKKKKRKPQTKLIEPDLPVFDEEVSEISFSDRFVCAPGVTFKDGTTVKSRPPQTNSNQLTRIQYEQYLEEMKKENDA